MTVKELKERLDKYPDNLVIALGYSATEEDRNGNIIPDRVFVYTDVLYNSQGEESLNVLRIA